MVIPPPLFCLLLLRALVFDNLVEDNARAGIFFHRSTDYAEAYGNTCRRNLEGDFGIVECTGVTVHDNVMEVSRVEPSGGGGGRNIDVDSPHDVHS